MNKQDFILMVKQNGDYSSKAEAERAVNAFISTLEDVLVAGDSVTFVGFATFETAIQKGKVGTVPGSDKKYESQEKRVPKFRSSIPLRKKVAGVK